MLPYQRSPTKLHRYIDVNAPLATFLVQVVLPTVERTESFLSSAAKMRGNSLENTQNIIGAGSTEEPRRLQSITVTCAGDLRRRGSTLKLNAQLNKQ